MLIHAHKMGFIGGLPYKYGVASLWLPKRHLHAQKHAIWRRRRYVFAQLTLLPIHFTMLVNPPDTPKVPLTMGHLHPHLIHGSLDQPDSAYIKLHLNQHSRFCTVHGRVCLYSWVATPPQNCPFTFCTNCVPVLYHFQDIASYMWTVMFFLHHLYLSPSLILWTLWRHKSRVPRLWCSIGAIWWVGIVSRFDRTLACDRHRQR